MCVFLVLLHLLKISVRCFCFIFACLFSKEGEKEGVELNGWDGGVDPRADERGKTITRIYCMNFQ